MEEKANFCAVCGRLNYKGRPAAKNIYAGGSGKLAPGALFICSRERSLSELSLRGRVL